MILINTYCIIQVSGRKTDVKDAQWIATLLQKGLLKESFIVEGIFGELREYERGYVRLCSHETRLEQAIERQLSNVTSVLQVLQLNLEAFQL